MYTVLYNKSRLQPSLIASFVARHLLLFSILLFLPFSLPVSNFISFLFFFYPSSILFHFLSSLPFLSSTINLCSCGKQKCSWIMRRFWLFFVQRWKMFRKTHIFCIEKYLVSKVASLWNIHIFEWVTVQGMPLRHAVLLYCQCFFHSHTPSEAD